jgi:hypothetical protein
LQRIAAMIDAEIERQIAHGPDTAPAFSEAELAAAERVGRRPRLTTSGTSGSASA